VLSSDGTKDATNFQSNNVNDRISKKVQMKLDGLMIEKVVAENDVTEDDDEMTKYKRYDG
jgi:hypothetical protein